ncbi:MAG TPA: class I SAM-dependent methyltransferase [Gemmataceae bacterium]|jgi:SAM-dependent methyltransferase|nr:class I SAM-dependent methyltransferase [Gemmataceae bacterium]
MNWKLKAHALALLSRVPGGKRAYHFLQSQLGTNKLDADESIRRAAEVVDMIRQAGERECRSVCLEIGTGWRPFLPFILCLADAEKVITIDINRWLNNSYGQETYRALAGQLGLISNRLGLAVTGVRERYQVAAHAKDLTSLLEAMRTEYRCPADARHTELLPASVDFVCSSNVLEHVSPGVLRDIHVESMRILRPGGLAVHRINPGDHFSHVDRSVTGVHFLRYSSDQWYWLGGSGLAYHNRLRSVQHQRLLEAAGFSILSSRVRIDPRSLEEITTGRQPIHSDFVHFAPEELAADYMWLVGRRPQ